MTYARKQFTLLSFALLLTALLPCLGIHENFALAQDSDAPPTKGQQRDGAGEGRFRPAAVGKITAVNGNTITLATPENGNVTIKLTDKTEYRKDRQSAKLSDFKVGDLVMIRGEENADHTITAQMVGGRSGNGPGGGMGGAMQGTLGKDYVIGEVKSIDAPKLTVLRTDNVTQTLELNEETSLRKGRDSVTMADIQAGDHVVARGAVQNDVFVPKSLMVISAEQWKRMQEMRANGTGAPAAAPAPKNPQ